jgi:hypothetical protein
VATNCAVLSLLAFVVIFILCSEDLIERLGNFTLWSAGLWVVSLLFGSASLVSFWLLYKVQARECIQASAGSRGSYRLPW